MDDVFAVAVGKPERRIAPNANAKDDQAHDAGRFDDAIDRAIDDAVGGADRRRTGADAVGGADRRRTGADAVGGADRRHTGADAPAARSGNKPSPGRDAMPAGSVPEARTAWTAAHAADTAPPMDPDSTPVPGPDPAAQSRDAQPGEAGIMVPVLPGVPASAPSPVAVSVTAVPAQAGMPAQAVDGDQGAAPERMPRAAAPAGPGRGAGLPVSPETLQVQTGTAARDPAAAGTRATEGSLAKVADGSMDGAASRLAADARPGAQATAQPTGFADAMLRPGIAGPVDPAVPPRATASAAPPAALQVAEQVVRIVHAGRNQLRIDLSPAELGRVRVEAEFGDGRVTLVIQADRPETLDLLRTDMRTLERALGEAGLKLDPSSVQFNLRGEEQQRGFAMAGGGARDDRDRQGDGRGAGADAGDDGRPDRAERLGVPTDGVVDVMV